MCDLFLFSPAFTCKNSEIEGLTAENNRRERKRKETAGASRENGDGGVAKREAKLRRCGKRTRELSCTIKKGYF